MSVVGEYRFSASTPMGEKTFVVSITEDGNGFSGTFEFEGSISDARNLEVDGDSFKCDAEVNSPMGVIDATLNATVEGDVVKGDLMTPFMPIPVFGERL